MYDVSDREKMGSNLVYKWHSLVASDAINIPVQRWLLAIEFTEYPPKSLWFFMAIQQK